MSGETSSQTVGFIGLGTMGKAMAGRLLARGNAVTVWNRSMGPSGELVAQGAVVAGDAAGTFASGVTISMLANDDAVLEVFSPELLAMVPPGSLHVGMSTVSIEAAEELVRRHLAAGVGYISAPVLGRFTLAEAGMLTVLAAGPDDLVEQALPVLEDLGRRVWRFGVEPQWANLIKIWVNYHIHHAAQALGESITVLETFGIDGNQFVDLLSDSLFPGPVYAGYGHAIANRSYQPPGFTVDLAFKDLLLAVAIAEKAGLPLPSAPSLVAVFEEARRRDLGGADWAATSEVMRQPASDSDQSSVTKGSS
jgi:3-hydroxyisobutyrate dehydrogenase-like beta-hydroxyacid dehydrogenase